jgi:D-alanyl-D-alanine carboxypeptidase
MNKKIIVKLALTSIAVAAPVIGLSGVVAQGGTAAKDQEAQAKKAFGWAKKAEKLMAKGKSAAALDFAEMAVAAEMNNVDYRALLARVYMKEGRFHSAERTLMDVTELGQADARTVVSLALSRIGQGKVDSAIALVDANQSILPASDYGLALALAGDTKRGISVLVEAIRSNNASVRTRQNLALAYALDGRWRDSQVMALEDMPQHMVDRSIIEWAQFARPGAYTARIAGLLRVEQKEDPGQPVRLALNAVAGEVNMAAAQVPQASEASVLPAMIASIDPNVELAAIGPAPVEAPPVEIIFRPSAPAMVAAAEAPLIKAPEGPAKRAQTAPVAAKPAKMAQAAPVAAKPVKLALADTAPRKVAGTHLIQLGAFSSTANAQVAWSQFTRKFGVLQGFNSASSSVVVNGKQLVRLAAMGFGNAGSATAVCNQIKARGGDCVVKSVNGSAPVRMAAATPKKQGTVKQGRRIASR